MNNLKILKWKGRLGNNIMQVRNALHICYFYKVNLYIPKHNFFNCQYININKNFTNNKNYFYNFNNNFRIRSKINNVNKKCFDLNYDLVLNKLKEITKNSNKYDFDNDDLLIHIRGGDILKNHWNPYIPVPISYYSNIIKKEKWNNIYIISESKNFIVKELLYLFPNIIFENDTLENDISKIISCKNLIISIGTFTTELILFNTNIKNIYIPEDKNIIKEGYYNEINYDFIKYVNCNIHKINLSEYFKKIGVWKNLDYQKKLLLEYKL